MIPKNFIPGKNRKLKMKKLEKPKKLSLSELIIDETELGYNNKALDQPPLNQNVLVWMGVTPDFVKETLWITYHYGNCPDIMLIEYNSKTDLEKDLIKIFEKGINMYNEIEKVYQTFMFKDDIAIFISPHLREKAVPYYRNLGFKQLECILKGK